MNRHISRRFVFSEFLLAGQAIDKRNHPVTHRLTGNLFTITFLACGLLTISSLAVAQDSQQGDTNHSSLVVQYNNNDDTDAIDNATSEDGKTANYHNSRHHPKPTPPPAPTGGAIIGSNQGIMWGVNDHQPIEGGPYSSIPQNTQMATVASLNLKNVRMDVGDDSASTMSMVASMTADGQQYGVQLFPVLNPSFLSYSDETSAYNAGYSLGSTYASAFKNSIQVWELGNEYDGQITINGDGSQISQYNQSQFVLARGMIHGLLDGIHAGNPNAKGIVDTVGVCHYGFTDGLWSDNIHWDITAFHWYNPPPATVTSMPGYCSAGPTNVVAIMQQHYGKPIWFTEFNYYNNADKNGMATWLVNIMTQWNSIAQTYDIEGGQIYELYDQPNVVAGQQTFGIASSTGIPNVAGDAVKNFLEQHPSVIYNMTSP